MTQWTATQAGRPQRSELIGTIDPNDFSWVEILGSREQNLGTILSRLQQFERTPQRSRTGEEQERVLGSEDLPLRAVWWCGSLGDESRCQRRPSRLMTGSAAAAGLGVEVFMELHQIPPMRIVGMLPIGPETRTTA